MIDNPVLARELPSRSQLRRPRAGAAAVASVILLAVGCLYWFLFQMLVSADSPDASEMGWSVAIWLQFMILIVMAPVVAANSISREREQQTWEMLVFTRLKPFEIVFGKLAARVIFLVVIFALFVPAIVIAWAFGLARAASGLQLVKIACGEAAVTTVSLAFACIGLYASSVASRTLYAVMASYTLCIGILCVGTALLANAWSELMPGQQWDGLPLIWANPFQMLTFASSPDKPYAVPRLFAGLVFYMLAAVLCLWGAIARVRKRS